MKFLIGVNRSQKGSNLTEYALLAALIAVAGIVSLNALSAKIHCSFTRTAAEVGGGEGTGLDNNCLVQGQGTTENGD